MKKHVMAGVLMSVLAPLPALATPVPELTQYGITWTFQDEVEAGQFANGDYWVVGPVTITSISPEFDGSHNGWQVNPAPGSSQGYDARITAFEATLVPTVPFTAQPGESIVQSVSLQPLTDTACRPCLDTAAVLTVLSEVPPQGGATSFRPPYAGTDKQLYSVSSLKTQFLPALDPVANTPALATMASAFQRVQLDHKLGWTGRFLHPAQNMPDYGSDIASGTGAAALRLMLNEPIDEKMPLLINYVQAGLDYYAVLKAGGTWDGDGGHGEGRKLPMAFAGVLLDVQEIKEAVAGADEATFGENTGVEFSDNAGGALFAQVSCSEEGYWKKLADQDASGAKTCADPYGYIDGGEEPGISYLECCLAKPWQYASLAARMIPALRTVWNHEPFHDFVDRYSTVGIWTQPDPCAPPDSTSCCEGAPNDNYGVTFGPDGNGGCIPDTDPSDGIGRVPANHGTNADFGYHGDEFGSAMWTTHYVSIPSGCQDESDCASGEVCCDGSCITPSCTASSDCDDQDPNSLDTCVAPGTCSAWCDHSSQPPQGDASADGATSQSDGGKEAGSDAGGDSGAVRASDSDTGCFCGVGRATDKGGFWMWGALLLLLARRSRGRSTRS